MSRLFICVTLVVSCFSLGCASWRPWPMDSTNPMEETINQEQTDIEESTDSSISNSLDQTTDEFSAAVKYLRKSNPGTSKGTGLSDRTRDVERNLGFR